MDQVVEDDIVRTSTNRTRDSQHVEHEDTTPMTPLTTGPSVGSNVENEVPTVGMAFGSAEDAKSFYSDYAERMGFEVISRNSRKQAGDGSVRYIMLACSRQGNPKAKTVDGLKARKSKRIQCSAKITVALNSNTKLWHILSVNLDHIHTVSPSKSRLFAANRHISMEVQRTLLINDEAGVKMNKTYRSLIHDAGGFQNVAFVERDLRNFVAKERRLLGKYGDGQALLAYFSRMQKQNSNFFYDIDLDDEFHVRNVFWADARTRAAYESFGDVITFDTTYLTNKYDMPFAPFVGVNHHGQSTLLGCGLLSSEDTGCFVWLFQSYLRCMSDKVPIGIITDQCQAMKNAISIVFPNSRHRWCLWHIMKKIPEKLARYDKYKHIKHDIKRLVYDTLSVADFETNWATVVQKFGLKDNEWLNSLWEERARWVPIYLKQYFWAGMSTTQRSESVNAFFDGYINSKTSLAQFVTQYDNALRDRAEKEYEADFRSSETTMMLCSPSLIEKQFQSEYTHAKFIEVQIEFRAKMNCCIVTNDVQGSVYIYSIREEMTVNDRLKEVVHKVSLCRDSTDVDCTCLLFQFRGILCRHTLCVLQQERITKVSPKYVLSRWSKSIRRRHTYIRSSYDVKQLEPQMQRYDNLCKSFFIVAEEAAANEETSKQFADAIELQRHRNKEFKAANAAVCSRSCKRTTHEGPTSSQQNASEGSPSCQQKGFEGSPTCQHNDLSQNEHVQSNDIDKSLSHVQSPRHVVRKGRPRQNRKKSTVEQLMKKNNKKNNSSNNAAQTMMLNETSKNPISPPLRNNIVIESSLKLDRANESQHVPLGSTSLNAVNDVHIFEDDSCLTGMSQTQWHGFSALLASVDTDIRTRQKEPISQSTSASTLFGSSFNPVDYTELGHN